MLKPISEETRSALAQALHSLIPNRSFVLLVEQPEQPHSLVVTNAITSIEAKSILNRCAVKPWNFSYSHRFEPLTNNTDGTQQG
jgi:hypothetical protein